MTVSHVANPTANAAEVLEAARLCHERSVAIAVFPELCLSGYAIEDLLMQQSLLEAVEQALASVVEASANWMTALVVGCPLRHGARIYNCATVIHRGRLLGVVPKTYLPTYREFYEARHFGSGWGLKDPEICIGNLSAPIGTNLLFEAEVVQGLIIGVEICEDSGSL